MAQANKINLWLTYSLLGVFSILFLLVVGFYFHYRSTSALVKEIAVKTPVALQNEAVIPDPSDWRTIYPNPKPMQIAGHEVLASVASTMSERIIGLSGTSFLPQELVKLFVFDAPGLHSIWMKDMNYSLDIIWADQDAKIIYLEEDVKPESFPNFFTPNVPAKYVIETNAGFVARNQIEVGEMLVLPNL